MLGLNTKILRECSVPLPMLHEQERIASVLDEQMEAVERARAATQARLEAARVLPGAFAREALQTGQTRQHILGDCLVEVKNGVGADWLRYQVLGATRDGLAPAKEGVGKIPERYKLVDPVTVFYNPMRILLGSIAMVDWNDTPGITSPDYVVVKGRSGILDTRWFYYWFRSVRGARLIDSLSRGAVRERILFNRLAAGKIDLPDYESQLRASERMKQVRPVVASITKELETINALPAVLLRRAFSGEL
jgi:type I restriction enzyme S subunit